MVTAVGHELQVLSVRDEAAGEAKPRDQNPVSRRLVVKSKALAVVADPGEALGKREPLDGAGGGLDLGALMIARTQGIQAERMFEIGQNQLLMLLLVIQPERQNRGDAVG